MGEVKRLGDDPTVVRLKVGSSAVEVATHADQAERLLGPFRQNQNPRKRQPSNSF